MKNLADYSATSWHPGQLKYARTAASIGMGDEGRFGIEGPCGCHPAGTLVLMADGRRVPVEAIQVGDSVMGPNGARTVLRLHRGRSEMYRVTPIKGDPWECNADHELVLVHMNTGRTATVKAKDYASKSTNWRWCHKQFAAPVQQFAGELQSLPLDPYFFGVWLGDGTKGGGRAAITKPDPEIEAVCRAQAALFGLRVRRSKNTSKCPTWHITQGKGGRPNLCRTAINLAVEQMWTAYCCGSIETRRAWLAGFLDTDGCRVLSGYEICQKNAEYVDAICFVARSLGLRATCRDKIVNGVVYKRIVLSGDCTALPLRIPRKQPLPRRQRKNVLRTGIRVDSIGLGEYFGFEVDGDHLFLLGDFTVVHNSGKSLGYLRAAFSPGFPKCNVLSTTRAHLTQLEDTLKKHFPDESWAVLRGRSFYPCCAKLMQSKEDPDASPEEKAAAKWGNSKGDKCPAGPDCEYIAAIMRCSKAHVVLQCTIGFLYRKEYWGGDEGQMIIDREVCILDEAHEYVQVRRSYETRDLPLSNIKMPMPMPPALKARLEQARLVPGSTYKRGYVLLSDAHNLRLAGAMAKWLRTLIVPADLERRRPNTANTPAKWEKMKEKYVACVRARISALEEAESDDPMRPVLALNFPNAPREPMSLRQEPVFAYIGEKLAPIEIFTSATLVPCADLLKLQRVEVIDEVFDWDQNVEAMPLEDDAGSFSNTPMDPELLRALYEDPTRPLTIALYISKAHVKKAADALKGRAGVLVQGVDGTLEELVTKAKNMQSPFLLLYSGWVGTDIPGEKCLILGSAPRTPLGPVQEARKARGMGGGWNDKEKVISDRMKLKQGLGRALRSSEDTATVVWVHNRVFADMGLCPKTARLR